MDNILKKLEILTPSQEEMRKAHEHYMNYLRENKNNFSYWFPKLSIVSQYGIMVPQSYIVDVPEDIFKAFFNERKNDMEIVQEWAQKALLPLISQHFKGKDVFIKNGCYSGKFSFDKCCHIKPDATDNDIVRNLCNLQYDSILKETDGNLEIILREWIKPQEGNKTIYEGMPLRTEMRLFYDFSSHKPLYWVNYWNWDDCHDPICVGWDGERKEDADVYEEYYPYLEEELEMCQKKYWQNIVEALKNVTVMEGIWSVDFLFEDDKVWLIDAAIGQRSYYWDSEKIKAAMEG